MGSSQLTHRSVLDHSDEILEMKARQLLSTDDLHAFEFYLNEYRTARLSLTSFFNVLIDLLNTPEKVYLSGEFGVAGIIIYLHLSFCLLFEKHLLNKPIQRFSVIPILGITFPRNSFRDTST
jgi:hypothetical protein